MNKKKKREISRKNRLKINCDDAYTFPFTPDINWEGMRRERNLGWKLIGNRLRYRLPF